MCIYSKFLKHKTEKICTKNTGKAKYRKISECSWKNHHKLNKITKV